MQRADFASKAAASSSAGPHQDPAEEAGEGEGEGKAEPSEPGPEPEPEPEPTHAELEEAMMAVLPEESGCGKYPITLIRNAFYATPPAGANPSSYFDDLEVTRTLLFRS